MVIHSNYDSFICVISMFRNRDRIIFVFLGAFGIDFVVALVRVVVLMRFLLGVLNMMRVNGAMRR